MNEIVEMFSKKTEYTDDSFHKNCLYEINNVNLFYESMATYEKSYFAYTERTVWFPAPNSS